MNTNKQSAISAQYTAIINGITQYGYHVKCNTAEVIAIDPNTNGVHFRGDIEQAQAFLWRLEQNSHVKEFINKKKAEVAKAREIEESRREFIVRATTFVILAGAITLVVGLIYLLVK